MVGLLQFRFIALIATVMIVTAGCGGDDSTGPTTGETPAASTTSADTAPPPAASSPLQLTLASPPQVNSTVVEVTLTNTSDGTMRVVRPFVTPHFVVFRVLGPDGVEIPFDGPYGRLEPLNEGDIAALAPAESVSATFDLADHFAVPGGTVTVSAEYRAREVHHDGLALTIDPGEPVVAEPLALEVGP